ncbi:MAG: formate--tetrahydrofolate ligase, partial [Lactiplantibacillus plantarum]|nr:formate--tetrahydrofolate ligase [Lactiplantibacillus plantarum]
MKDIEIAQQVIPEPITAIAAKAGLTVEQIAQYGSTKAILKLP